MKKPKQNLQRFAKYKKKDQRKKHVESMFLTFKGKNYPYYYKKVIKLNRSAALTFNREIFKNFFGIRMIGAGYITIYPLKSIVRIFKWFVKTNKIEDGKLKLKLYVFPDFVLTGKPKEMRMGKGKGSEKKKVSYIKSGSLFLTLRYTKDLHYTLVLKLIKRISKYIPLRHKILSNFW